MSNTGISFPLIQEISGYRNLGELQNYLEVRESQVKGAVSSLSMVSQVEKSSSPFS